MLDDISLKNLSNQYNPITVVLWVSIWKLLLWASINWTLTFTILGPWWWSSGQRSCLLLQRSEFESCWLLNKFSVRKDENKRKRGRGWPIFKKKCTNSSKMSIKVRYEQTFLKKNFFVDTGIWTHASMQPLPPSVVSVVKLLRKILLHRQRYIF